MKKAPGWGDVPERWYDSAQAIREARDKLMQDTMWSTDGEKTQALLFAMQALMTQLADRAEKEGSK
jgi:hypothetical protein